MTDSANAQPLATRTTAVIGAAGHVGLGLSLVLANNGHRVLGVDINESGNRRIMAGKMPFLEESGQEYLDRALLLGSLELTVDSSAIRSAETVVVILGTPIDENLNPRFGLLRSLFDDLIPHLNKGQLIVLRSTVSPGTTTRVRRMIEERLGWVEGEDFYLVFAPERVLQGRCIAEMQSLPQIIGADTNESFERAHDFFATYVQNECIRLTSAEAELGKLITNMSRYLSFAFANEVYLIADQWHANANRIIDAINRDYPRLAIPRPGPNVGGPCLYKDGYFLVERTPFPELISTAFKINEGMTAQIAAKIEAMEQVRKVGILGMAFKADNDDTRNSLSFKLRKQLDDGLHEVVCYDPYVPEFSDPEVMSNVDCVVLMTPHAIFRQLDEIATLVDNPACIMIDVWGFWAELRYSSRNGIFELREAAQFLSATYGG